jgi:hypothetical protein
MKKDFNKEKHNEKQAGRLFACVRRCKINFLKLRGQE